MTLFAPEITRIAAKADVEEQVCLPGTNTECTAYLEVDWSYPYSTTCSARLIGLLINFTDEFMTPDEVVERFGMDAVKAWEAACADRLSADAEAAETDWFGRARG